MSAEKTEKARRAIEAHWAEVDEQRRLAEDWRRLSPAIKELREKFGVNMTRTRVPDYELVTEKDVPQVSHRIRTEAMFSLFDALLESRTRDQILELL